MFSKTKANMFSRKYSQQTHTVYSFNLMFHVVLNELILTIHLFDGHHKNPLLSRLGDSIPRWDKQLFKSLNATLLTFVFMKQMSNLQYLRMTSCLFLFWHNERNQEVILIWTYKKIHVVTLLELSTSHYYFTYSLSVPMNIN